MKITKRENIRLEVTADMTGWRYVDPDSEWKILEDIKARIVRHVDGYRDLHITSAMNDYCEHCGAPWTENGTIYNGGCCDKDIAGGFYNDQA